MEYIAYGSPCRNSYVANSLALASIDHTDEPWTPEVVRIAEPRSKRLRSDKQADRKAAAILKTRIERPAARKFGFTDYQLIEQAQADDKDAAWELIQRYRDHIESEASHRYIRGLDRADKIGHATIGFLNGIATFDLALGFQLSTHTRWSIRAELKKAALEANPAINTQGRKGESDGALTRRRAFAAAPFKPSSLYEPAYSPDSDGRLEHKIDQLKDEDADDSYYLHQYGHEILTSALNTLGPRECKIIEARRLLDKRRTFDELAAQFGISRETVRQIDQRAFKEIAAHIWNSASTHDERIHRRLRTCVVNKSNKKTELLNLNQRAWLGGNKLTFTYLNERDWLNSLRARYSSGKAPKPNDHGSARRWRQYDEIETDLLNQCRYQLQAGRLSPGDITKHWEKRLLSLGYSPGLVSAALLFVKRSIDNAQQLQKRKPKKLRIRSWRASA